MCVVLCDVGVDVYLGGWCVVIGVLLFVYMGIFGYLELDGVVFYFCLWCLNVF